MFNYVSKGNIPFVVETVPVVYLPKCKQYNQTRNVNLFQQILICLQNCFLWFWLSENIHDYQRGETFTPTYVPYVYPFICEWIEVGKSLKITIGSKLL